MKRLKVENFGDKVQGVHLHGDRRNPEPVTFVVAFPGGSVEVSRTADEQYWVHVHTNEAGKEAETEDAKHPLQAGRICDGRLDLRGKHAGEADGGDIDSPDLYHLAVRVATEDQA